MSTGFAIAFVDNVNNLLDSGDVLQIIDFHADKVQQSGETIKAFCPIHNDSRFRSLLVDTERHAFRCTIKTCRGYSGGSLVELYALSRETSILAAACQLVQAMEMEMDPDWRDQLAESYLNDARDAQSRGDFTEAESLLREIITVTPDLSDARVMLASIHVEMGNMSEAAEEYVRLIEHFLASDKLSEADALAGNAIQAFPDNEDLLFMRVKIADELGDNELTIELMREIVGKREAGNRHLDNIGILEQLVEKAPERAEFPIKLAGLYEQQHNVSGASRQYEKAAQIYLSSGQVEQGIELLEKVVQFNAENLRARLELTKHLIEVGEIAKARDHTFRAINQQIDQQDFVSATSITNEWLEREPDNIEAREILARIFLDQERTAEAAGYLAEGAEVAAGSGNHNRAADLLLRAKFLTPDVVPLRRRLIEEFQTMGEQQRAAFEIIDLAEILYSSDLNDEAKALLVGAISSEISLPLKLQMVTSLSNHGSGDEALGFLRELAESIDEFAPPEEAADLYELLVRLEPHEVEHHRRHVKALWLVAPERGADAAVESAQWLLTNEHRSEAEIVLKFAVESLEEYVPASPRLFGLCEQAGRMDLAGAVYQVSIQGFADQNPEAALKAARRMQELDAAHPSAPSDIAFLLAALDRTEEAADQYAQVASTLLAAGDYETGLQYAREGVAHNPDSLNALAAQAMLAREILSPEETAPLTDDLLRATRSTTDPKDAATGYLAYLELFPNDIDLLKEAETALKTLGATEAAVQIEARQAGMLSAKGDWAGASEKLKSAAEGAPDMPQIHEQYGETCRVIGERDAAALAFSHAAAAYARLGDLDAAARCVNSAQVADPTSTEALEALYTAAEAAELPAVSSACAENLTTIFTENNRSPSVAKWAREWVRLAPENAAAQEALGMALMDIDQPENGARILSTAAALYLEKEDFGRSLGTLRKLAQRGILTKNDRETLSEIAARTVDDEHVKAQATLLIGRSFIQTNELDAAKETATDMALDASKAELWTEIARSETDSASATTAHLEAARAWRDSGDRNNAIASLRAGMALGSPGLDLYEMLATLLADAGDFDEALPYQLHILREQAGAKADGMPALLESMRSVHQNHLETRTQIAGILLEAGRRDLALEDMEAAATLANASNNTAALATICSMDEELTRQSPVLTSARADALMGMENAQQALEWVTKSGHELLAAGKPAEAMEMAQRWISMAGDDPHAHQLMANASAANGDVQAAIEANLTVARLLIKHGEEDRAIQLLDEILDSSAGLQKAMRLKVEAHKSVNRMDIAAEILIELGDAQQAGDDSETAMASYREAVALDSQNPTALWKLADSVRNVKGIPEAAPLYRQWAGLRREIVDANQWIVDLQDLVSILPETAQLRRDLSNALVSAGRSDEAKPHLEQLADLLETEGDYLGAAEVLETTSSHAGMISPEQRLIIANLYEKSNNPARAQEHLRQAAQALNEHGKTAESAKVFDRLLKLSGDSALPEDYGMAAMAHARAGELRKAAKLIDRAIAELSVQSGNKQRREKLLAQALEIAPLNPDYVLHHIDLLPGGRAMTEGLARAREMGAAGHADDAIRVLTQVIALAPHDMSLRQEIFAPLRQTGNTNRLRQELLALANDALACGDTDAACEAMDEAATLAASAPQHRALAELNERARRLDKASAEFTTAALMFSEDGKTEQAIATINRAVSARPSAIPAESMATLVRRMGPAVHDIAHEQLRSALTARHQKQSQLLALALLETAAAGRGDEILKTVHTLGGSTFLVGIAHSRIYGLLDQNDIETALNISNSIIEIAPDSPDAWYMAAQVYKQVQEPGNARRAALEAARLYSMAGAVSEEENCYTEALAAEPDNLDVKATLAEYLIREHRVEEAVSLLQEIIASAEQTGNSDLQMESLNRAVQVAPGNTDLREKLATLLETIAPDSAISNWLQTAEMFEEADQPERTKRIYEHVLQLHPMNEVALQALLKDARHKGDLDAACRLTKNLSDVMASRKNFGEACRILQAYLELDPDHLEILEKLSTLAGTSNDVEVFTTTTRALAKKFQKMGDNENALRHYEMLLERSPRDAGLLTTLLDCCAAAGLPEKGITYARQLLAVARDTEDPERIRLAAATILNYDDSDADAHNDLAESLLSLNRIPQAATEWMRAAEIYEGSGNTVAAFKCYRQVTQIHAGDARAWKHLADLAITIGDTETARTSLFHLLDTTTGDDNHGLSPLMQKFISTGPDDPDVHQTALKFYLRTNDKDNATVQYLWLSDNAEKAGNDELAESFLSDGLKFAPENPELKTAQYELILRMGRHEELQLRLRQEAEEHERNGNLGDAVAVMSRILEFAPGQINLHNDMARLLNQANKPDEAIDQHLQVIRLLLGRGELEEARENAEALVSKYPETRECREKIADTLMESNYPDLAARYYRTAADAINGPKNLERRIALLSKAVEARPSWVETRKILAETCESGGKLEDAFHAWITLIPTLLESGEFTEAAATLNRLSRLKPESPEVREQLAGLYEKTGKRDQQIEVLRDLVEIYEKAGQDKDCLDAYHRLAAIAPDDPVILTRYLELLSQMEETEKNLPQEYSRLADILAERGDFEGASQTYEQILGLAPDNTSARSRYAAFLLSRGNRNRALTEMRNLSELYMNREEPAAAVDVLNAALTITPRDADLCLALASAQEAAGLHEDARVTYARASAILASTAAVKGIDTYRRILTQDPDNTAVRLRLVELLFNSGDKMEAAREARSLAEIHINRGEMAEAENAYRIVDDCEPESVDDVREAIQRDSYDPSLQYVHYVRLGNRLFEKGDIDNALDAYRTARSLHDDQPDLIRKCIDCVSLIAPEAEAIPDYLVMAEKMTLAGDLTDAQAAYEKVRLIDPFNNDAKCGLESVTAIERGQTSTTEPKDDLVLKTGRPANKRVALVDLLVACQDAARDQSSNPNRLSNPPK